MNGKKDHPHRGEPRLPGLARRRDCRVCHVPNIWRSQTSGARRQVRHGGVCPQKRAPDYPIILAWSAFLLFLGAGAFALGMTIHNQALAKEHSPPPEPIYYCSTGVEMPLYEPCKEMKDQRDI